MNYKDEWVETWYDRYADEDYDWVEQKRNDSYRRVQDILKNLITELYVPPEVNAGRVEDHLDRLCGFFELRLPPDELMIRRK